MGVRNAMFEFEEWLGAQPMMIALPAMAACVIVGLGIVVAAIIAPVVWWQDRQPRFTLAKAEWECTVSHEVYVPPMMAGKVMIPGRWEAICDQYQRSR